MERVNKREIKIGKEEIITHLKLNSELQYKLFMLQNKQLSHIAYGSRD